MILQLGLSRGVLETRQFFRARDSVIFMFALPILFMLIFGAIFGDQPLGAAGQGYTYSQALVPALMTFSILSTAMVNIGFWIAIDRENGTLRRLTTMPMPRPAYFLGKVVMVLVIGLISVSVLVAAGVLLYDVRLPATPGKWLTVGWVTVLGFAVLGVLGVAMSSLVTHARSAAAVMNLPALTLAFISGIFIRYTEIPGWMYSFAALFPVKWIAQGLRAGFLPDAYAADEPAGGWEEGRILLVLLAWLAIGVALCVTTFRWKRTGDG
ncbi:ABC transporter permease [Actinomycetes bacterium KLBMP 9797]